MARLLIVDDSASVRKLVRAHLRGLDCTFEEASNGAEGLKALSKSRFDLIIIDLMMPVMDGVTMLRMKDSMQDTTSVILLTAEVSDTLSQAMTSPCVMEYLRKPIVPNALQIAVRQVLALQSESASG